MAKLRGSQKISLTAVANTLELLLDMNDIVLIKSGIKGVISACNSEAIKNDKPIKKS